MLVKIPSLTFQYFLLLKWAQKRHVMACHMDGAGNHVQSTVMNLDAGNGCNGCVQSYITIIDAIADPLLSCFVLRSLLFLC